MLVTEKKESRSKQSGGRRRRMGRPPVSPESARSNRIVTFVTNSELSALEILADREDKSLSGVVHRILVRSLGVTRS